jgi:hypothetical protein
VGMSKGSCASPVDSTSRAASMNGTLQTFTR